MAEPTIIVCPHCGQTNRVPADKPMQEAICGACKKPLFDGHPADIDGPQFEKQISRSGVPVLVDVWAPWCGPCRMMAPEFEKAARELEPKVRLIKLNSENEQQAAARLGIRGIPTMILMHKGREVARTSGAMPAGQIVSWVRGQLH